MRLRRIMTSAGALATATVMLVGSPASAATASAANSATGGLRTTAAHARAASVSFRVDMARCSATAVKFRALQTETGFSGVQRFKQKATLQEFTSAGWQNRATKTIASTSFPNDGRNFSFTLNWTGTHPNNGASWREVWVGTYLNGGGGVVAKTKKILITCL